MTAEEFQEIEGRGGRVQLSGRACFRLTGADRLRFLNGQVTNDVRLAGSQEALHACVTDIKGHIVGDGFIHASSGDESLYLDAEPDLREVLGPRLERYIIADDVEMTDVTDEWRIWHVFGAGCTEPGARSELPEGSKFLKSSRLGVGGVDIWLPATAGAIEPRASCPLLSLEDFEQYRILRGIPRFPNELNSDTFPPEAGLDDCAVSYTKGCYIGQEILSRIRTTGKMPRVLVQWRMKRGSAGRVEPGDTLFVSQESGGSKPAGKITSVAWHPVLERNAGLAFLRQGLAVVDSELPVGGDTPRIDAQVEISSFVKQ